MEKYIQRTLQASILISWFLGLFPTRNALLTSKNFIFTWFSAGAIIAFATLLASCLNVIGVLYSFHSKLDIQPQALKLVVISVTVIAVTYTALARFCSLIFCSKLVTLIRLLEELRILCSQGSYARRGSRMRWRSRLTAVACVFLGLITVCHIRIHTVAVLTGDITNPLTALAFKRGVDGFRKLFLIFGYCNPIVTTNIIVALVLCIGNYLLWVHEQISIMLQYNLETSAPILDSNRNGQKLWLQYMQMFGKLKTCFQIYMDVLGRQSLLILVETVATVTYSTYFVLWPMDGSVSALSVPAALLTPALILWVGNTLENQVTTAPLVYPYSFHYYVFFKVNEYRQKIEDALANALICKQGARSEVS